ncbi:SCO-spondin-like isoform X2 [Hydractinia symbiolongicarpus]|nr:SCO-spondin-like isoform X2 [Hydractinia symbiolongicarpus]
MSPNFDVTDINMACVAFDYNMNGADMGSLYLVHEYTSFDSVVNINPSSLTNDGTRKEILVNSGNRGDQWISFFSTVDLTNIANFQVKFQIITGPGPRGDVALDNITIAANQGICPVDPCTGVTCQNGGTCNGGTCMCVAGYTGQFCETGIDSCTGVTCQNGGTCNGGTCMCVAGYTGQFCETRIDPCIGVTCQNGGTCNGGTCMCVAGYTGQFCETRIDPCTGVTCQNGGTCNGGTCMCVAGYTGQFCETRIDPCIGVTCQNGGTCNGGTCMCVAGYTGQFCETRIDPCIGVTCQNGGTCNGGTCMCVAGYTGQFCETGIDSCIGVTCQNGGTCNGGTCMCVAGYTGQFCETGIDPCTGVTCQNNGTCNAGTCSCVRGFIGANCETAIALPGDWGPWLNVTNCSMTCGTGYFVQERRCDNPPPINGGIACELRTGSGLFENRTVSCMLTPCPDPCASVTCQNNGTCNAGTCSCVRGFIGANCETAIALPGDWGPWLNVTNCSMTCGTGYFVQERHCDNPPPINGGIGCELRTGSGLFENRTVSCMLTPCPVNGMWGNWTYSSCSKTCGGGVLERTRMCNNPTPAGGGNLCLKTDNQTSAERETQTQACNEDVCPVHGGWSEWSSYTSCSSTCGVGTQSRTRSCNNPAPSNGGTECSGSAIERPSCFSSPCPVPGVWSVWGSWSACQVTCGNGIISRTRTCSNNNCNGNATETAYCVGGCRKEICPMVQSNIDCNFETACWFASADGGFQIAGRTETPSTGPSIDHTFNKTGCGSFAFLEASGRPVGFTSYLASSLTMLNQSDVCFTFYASMYTAFPEYMGSLSVFLVENGTNTQTPLWQHNGVLTNTPLEWKQVNIDVNYAGSNSIYFLFKAVRGTSFSSDIAIDDGSLAFGPCTGQVDGNWGEWGSWGTCDISCGEGGMLRRYRNCSSPTPSNGGKNCTGMGVDSTPCPVVACPINGNWTMWTNWTACSKSCDNGTRTRLRECANPAPSFGGDNCTRLDGTMALEEASTERCNTDPCFRQGGWSDWFNSTSCSQTCGNGTYQRNRTCDNPTPIGENSWCVNLNNMTALNETGAVPCLLVECPVHGGWSEWSNYTACSQTCDNGTYSRNRTCNNPAPAFNGSECLDSTNTTMLLMENVTEVCQIVECIVPGDWSDYVNVTECSKSCGNGTVTQERYCNNPTPRGGGIACEGPEGPALFQNKTLLCNTNPCPVNGTWGNWTEYSPCSVTCGNGTKNKNRSCDNPAPAHGGYPCTLTNGSMGLFEMKFMSCEDEVCPVNGSWSEWSNATMCSKSCGNGTYTRERFCNNPPKAGSGMDCVGGDNTTYDTETLDCNTHNCPIHGNWTEWSSYSDCSVTCGNGTKERNRTCTDPPPQFGGDECMMMNTSRGLVEYNSTQCNRVMCPIHGGWNDWYNSTCNATCGGGYITASRECENPPPNYGGNNCTNSKGVEQTGIEMIVNSCNNHSCPVHGNWSTWSGYTACSLTCGNGTKSRNRTCNNPVPMYGGLLCNLTDGTNGLEEIETMDCFEAHCPDPYDCSFESSPNTKTMCNFTIDGTNNRWSLHTGRTDTRDTGPYNDHTYGNSSGYYLYFEASGFNPVTDVRYPADNDFASIGKFPAFSGFRCMRFWLHMYENSTLSATINPGEFRVIQVSSNGTEWDLLKRTTFFPDNIWYQQDVNITATSMDYEIRFYGRRVDYYADRAIDDVSFYDVSCPEVDALIASGEMTLGS